MSVLTSEDKTFFAENGYVIARNVVPPADCEAVIDAIFAHLGMDRNNPDDWYRPPLTNGGMVEFYQHQALWNNRQNPRVYEAFTEILGSAYLWVSLDRAGFKPPQNADHPEYDHKGFIHWDADTSKLPQSFGVQGVLCLSDTAADMGGFQCIPGFHNNLEAWIAAQPADRNPRAPDLTGLSVVPIPANQGDLIIWNRLLAHGNGHNVSHRPRFSQYITMYPASNNEEQRQHRIQRWQERLPTGPPYFPGDAREIEQQFGTTAELTPLGRKLLGVDSW